jgi:predicted MFS family arabinose efflux permease
LYASCTEGIAKAWISKIVDGKEVGSAIGNYSTLESITSMLASFLGGMIWFSFGAQAFFVSTGILALTTIIYFNINRKFVDT